MSREEYSLAVKVRILRLLSRGDMRLCELDRQRGDCTFAIFKACFYWLLRDGDIVKSSSERVAAFRITEKGKRFLSWRGNDSR